MAHYSPFVGFPTPPMGNPVWTNGPPMGNPVWTNDVGGANIYLSYLAPNFMDVFLDAAHAPNPIGGANIAYSPNLHALACGYYQPTSVGGGSAAEILRNRAYAEWWRTQVAAGAGNFEVPGSANITYPPSFRAPASGDWARRQMESSQGQSQDYKAPLLSSLFARSLGSPFSKQSKTMAMTWPPKRSPQPRSCSLPSATMARPPFASSRRDHRPSIRSR